MHYKLNEVEMQEEFRTCPTCGYRDGFHSMFRREEDTVKWFFICPSCRDVFDLGLTVPQPEERSSR